MISPSAEQIERLRNECAEKLASLSQELETVKGERDQLLKVPPLWQHAVTECNEAHAALDRHGAPATKRVRRVRGPEGEQDITIGLASRINALAALLRERPQEPTNDKGDKS